MGQGKCCLLIRFNDAAIPNQLLEDADYTYEYTVNGQLQRKTSKSTGEKTDYTWNVEGKVVSTTVRRADNSIKSQVINKYDALDRRVERNSTKYVYDGEDIIMELGNNGAIKALYLHGPGIDEPIAMVRDINEDGNFSNDELFFYSKDHLNSIHDLTDYQGKPIQRYNYTAYGRTQLERLDGTEGAKFIQSPYGYTSREWEQESGDYYYRDRNYDPRSGRFLAEDRIGFDGGDENLYRYVKNNPILARDPSGNFAQYGFLAVCGAGLTIYVAAKVTAEELASNQCRKNDRNNEELKKTCEDAAKKRDITENIGVYLK